MKSRLLKIILACCFLTGLLTTQLPAAGAGTADDEAQFIALINDLRSRHGLQSLTPNAELHNGAVNWTAVLANNGELSHAPDLSAGVTAVWAKLGENVGVASEGQTQQLFDAFVASPSHYANLIDPDFQYIGVSVMYDDTGRMWTTHRFMKTFDDAPAQSTTIAPTPTTAATTTQPPATNPPAEPEQPTETTSGPVSDSTTTEQAAASSEVAGQPASSTPATTPLDTEYVAEVIGELAVAGI